MSEISPLDFCEVSQRITANDEGFKPWLSVEPCYVNFEDPCDEVNLDVYGSQVDIEVTRIPTVIEALKLAYKKATGTEL